jgi:hypothetical protein
MNGNRSNILVLGGGFGGLECRVARAPARALGETRPTQRMDSGLPVREDNQCRRKTTRLRRRQEGARQVASSASGH